MYFIFNSLDENVSVFLSDGEFYLLFRYVLFVLVFMADNTKMPKKNWLLAQPYDERLRLILRL